MLKSLLVWIKNKYYDWRIDKELSISSGTSDTSYLNPFGSNSSNTIQSSESFYFQDETQRKYKEALLKIKRKINDEVGDKTKENYEKILSNFSSDSDEFNKDIIKPNITSLAEEEDLPKHIEALRKIIYHKDKDIKTDEDKFKMIDERIGDYEYLQIKRQIRKINRDLRKAEREKNLELAKQLKENVNELSRQLPRKRSSKYTIS